MHRHSHRLALAALATLLIAPGTWGQGPGRHLRRHDGGLQRVRLDLATGTLVRSPRAPRSSGSTVTDFTNLDLGGFVGIDSGGGACQWIDAATKGQVAGNGSDLMSSIVLAYCSVALDPAVGGPGGALQLGFHEGYTSGGPAPTTGVATFALSGLPASTSCSSFTCGGFNCYYLTVEVDPVVPFADGAIGYSWLFTDLGTTGVLAATVPFLACVQSCSGPGPDGQGMRDWMDQYCPPGTLKSSFSFGTFPTGSYFTSISMEIREATDVVATVTTWNSEAINVDTLFSGPIVLGHTWTTALVENHSHGSGPSPMTLVVRTGCVNGTNVTSPVGGRPVEFLIAGSLALKLVGSHTPAGPSPFPDVPVPGTLALVGTPWAAQAIVLGGGFADLSSAACGIVGTIP
jgi:hypothetical protein